MSGPKRPSRRLAGLAGPPPTGVTAADEPVVAPAPEPTRPRARARGSAPSPAPAPADAPPPAAEPAPASTPTPAPDRAGDRAGGYERRRAVETAARAYAAARRRLDQREAALLAAAGAAEGQDVLAGLVAAGLDPVADVPEEVAQVMRGILSQ